MLMCVSGGMEGDTVQYRMELDKARKAHVKPLCLSVSVCLSLH